MNRSTQSSFSWYPGSVSKSHAMGPESNAMALGGFTCLPQGTIGGLHLPPLRHHWGASPASPKALLGRCPGGSALQPALEGEDIVLPVATVPPQRADGHQPAGGF